MANAVYPKGRYELAATGQYWTTGTFHAALVSSSYTYDQTDVGMDQVAGILAHSAATASRTISIDAANNKVILKIGTAITFTAASGGTATGLIIYEKNSTGTSSSDYPYIYIDNFTPFALTGSDVYISFTNQEVAYL